MAAEKTYHLTQNVGKAKYVVSFHNGEKTHGDGSPFFDIEIFKSRAKLQTFLSALSEQGYLEK